MRLNMFWSILISFIFKWLRWQWQSLKTSSLVGDCTKLAPFSSCIFVKFILYKLPLYGIIAMTLSFQVFANIRTNLLIEDWPCQLSLLTKNKLTCNLNSSLVDFIFHDYFYNNRFYSNGFDNTIITLMYIVWSDYLIYVKFGCIQSHVLSGLQIHDPLKHALRICSIMHYKCIVIIVLCILLIFTLLVLCFIVKCMMWSSLLQ